MCIDADADMVMIAQQGVITLVDMIPAMYYMNILALLEVRYLVVSIST